VTRVYETANETDGGGTAGDNSPLKMLALINTTALVGVNLKYGDINGQRGQQVKNTQVTV
jgi:hypothetical protein